MIGALVFLLGIPLAGIAPALLVHGPHLRTAIFIMFLCGVAHFAAAGLVVAAASRLPGPAMSEDTSAWKMRIAPAALFGIGSFFLTFLLGGVRFAANDTVARLVGGLVLVVFAGGYSLLVTYVLLRGLPRASRNLWIVLAMNAVLLLTALIVLIAEAEQRQRGCKCWESRSSRSRVRTAGWRWQPVPPGVTRRLDVGGSQFKSRPPRENEPYRDSWRLRFLRPGAVGRPSRYSPKVRERAVAARAACPSASGQKRDSMELLRRLLRNLLLPPQHIAVVDDYRVWRGFELYVAALHLARRDRADDHPAPRRADAADLGLDARWGSWRPGCWGGRSCRSTTCSARGSRPRHRERGARHGRHGDADDRALR